MDLRFGTAVRSGPLDAVCGGLTHEYPMIAAISGGKLSLTSPTDSEVHLDEELHPATKGAPLMAATRVLSGAHEIVVASGSTVSGVVLGGFEHGITTHLSPHHGKMVTIALTRKQAKALSEGLACAVETAGAAGPHEAEVSPMLRDTAEILCDAMQQAEERHAALLESLAGDESAMPDGHSHQAVEFSVSPSAARKVQEAILAAAIGAEFRPESAATGALSALTSLRAQVDRSGSTAAAGILHGLTKAPTLDAPPFSMAFLHNVWARMRQLSSLLTATPHNVDIKLLSASPLRAPATAVGEAAASSSSAAAIPRDASDPGSSSGDAAAASASPAASAAEAGTVDVSELHASVPWLYGISGGAVGEDTGKEPEFVDLDDDNDAGDAPGSATLRRHIPQQHPLRHAVAVIDVMRSAVRLAAGEEGVTALESILLKRLMSLADQGYIIAAPAQAALLVQASSLRSGTRADKATSPLRMLHLINVRENKTFAELKRQVGDGLRKGLFVPLFVALLATSPLGVDCPRGVLDMEMSAVTARSQLVRQTSTRHAQAAAKPITVLGVTHMPSVLHAHAVSASEDGWVTLHDMRRFSAPEALAAFNTVTGAGLESAGQAAAALAAAAKVLQGAVEAAGPEAAAFVDPARGVSLAVLAAEAEAEAEAAAAQAEVLAEAASTTDTAVAILGGSTAATAAAAATASPSARPVAALPMVVSGETGPAFDTAVTIFTAVAEAAVKGISVLKAARAAVEKLRGGLASPGTDCGDAGAAAAAEASDAGASAAIDSPGALSPSELYGMHSAAEVGYMPWALTPGTATHHHMSAAKKAFPKKKPSSTTKALAAKQAALPLPAGEFTELATLPDERIWVSGITADVEVTVVEGEFADSDASMFVRSMLSADTPAANVCLYFPMEDGTSMTIDTKLISTEYLRTIPPTVPGSLCFITKGDLKHKRVRFLRKDRSSTAPPVSGDADADCWCIVQGEGPLPPPFYRVKLSELAVMSEQDIGSLRAVAASKLPNASPTSSSSSLASAGGSGGTSAPGPVAFLPPPQDPEAGRLTAIVVQDGETGPAAVHLVKRLASALRAQEWPESHAVPTATTAGGATAKAVWPTLKRSIIAPDVADWGVSTAIHVAQLPGTGRVQCALAVLHGGGMVVARSDPSQPLSLVSAASEVRPHSDAAIASAVGDARACTTVTRLHVRTLELPPGWSDGSPIAAMSTAVPRDWYFSNMLLARALRTARSDGSAKGPSGSEATRREVVVVVARNGAFAFVRVAAGPHGGLELVSTGKPPAGRLPGGVVGLTPMAQHERRAPDTFVLHCTDTRGVSHGVVAVAVQREDSAVYDAATTATQQALALGLAPDVGGGAAASLDDTASAVIRDGSLATESLLAVHDLPEPELLSLTMHASSDAGAQLVAGRQRAATTEVRWTPPRSVYGGADSSHKKPVVIDLRTERIVTVTDLRCTATAAMLTAMQPVPTWEPSTAPRSSRITVTLPSTAPKAVTLEGWVNPAWAMPWCDTDARDKDGASAKASTADTAPKAPSMVLLVPRQVVPSTDIEVVLGDWNFLGRPATVVDAAVQKHITALEQGKEPPVGNLKLVLVRVDSDVASESAAQLLSVNLTPAARATGRIPIRGDAMPDQPGLYEFRVVHGSKGVVATASIAVGDVPVPEPDYYTLFTLQGPPPSKTDSGSASDSAASASAAGSAHPAAGASVPGGSRPTSLRVVAHRSGAVFAIAHTVRMVYQQPMERIAMTRPQHLVGNLRRGDWAHVAATYDGRALMVFTGGSKASSGSATDGSALVWGDNTSAIQDLPQAAGVSGPAQVNGLWELSRPGSLRLLRFETNQDGVISGKEELPPGSSDTSVALPPGFPLVVAAGTLSGRSFTFKLTSTPADDESPASEWTATAVLHRGFEEGKGNLKDIGGPASATGNPFSLTKHTEGDSAAAVLSTPTSTAKGTRATATGDVGDADAQTEAAPGLLTIGSDDSTGTGWVGSLLTARVWGKALSASDLALARGAADATVAAVGLQRSADAVPASSATNLPLEVVPVAGTVPSRGLVADGVVSMTSFEDGGLRWLPVPAPVMGSYASFRLSLLCIPLPTAVEQLFSGGRFYPAPAPFGDGVDTLPAFADGLHTASGAGHDASASSATAAGETATGVPFRSAPNIATDAVVLAKRVASEEGGLQLELPQPQLATRDFRIVIEGMEDGAAPAVESLTLKLSGIVSRTAPASLASTRFIEAPTTFATACRELAAAGSARALLRSPSSAGALWHAILTPRGWRMASASSAVQELELGTKPLALEALRRTARLSHCFSALVVSTSSLASAGGRVSSEYVPAAGWARTVDALLRLGTCAPDVAAAADLLGEAAREALPGVAAEIAAAAVDSLVRITADPLSLGSNRGLPALCRIIAVGLGRGLLSRTSTAGRSPAARALEAVRSLVGGAAQAATLYAEAAQQSPAQQCLSILCGERDRAMFPSANEVDATELPILGFSRRSAAAAGAATIAAGTQAVVALAPLPTAAALALERAAAKGGAGALPRHASAGWLDSLARSGAITVECNRVDHAEELWIDLGDVCHVHGVNLSVELQSPGTGQDRFAIVPVPAASHKPAASGSGASAAAAASSGAKSVLTFSGGDSTTTKSTGSPARATEEQVVLSVRAELHSSGPTTSTVSPFAHLPTAFRHRGPQLSPVAPGQWASRSIGAGSDFEAAKKAADSSSSITQGPVIVSSSSSQYAWLDLPLTTGARLQWIIAGVGSGSGFDSYSSSPVVGIADVACQSGSSFNLFSGSIAKTSLNNAYTVMGKNSWTINGNGSTSMPGMEPTKNAVVMEYDGATRQLFAGSCRVNEAGVAEDPTPKATTLVTTFKSVRSDSVMLPFVYFQRRHQGVRLVSARVLRGAETVAPADGTLQGCIATVDVNKRVGAWKGSMWSRLVQCPTGLPAASSSHVVGLNGHSNVRGVNPSALAEITSNKGFFVPMLSSPEEKEVASSGLIRVVGVSIPVSGRYLRISVSVGSKYLLGNCQLRLVLIPCGVRGAWDAVRTVAPGRSLAAAADAAFGAAATAASGAGAGAGAGAGGDDSRAALHVHPLVVEAAACEDELANEVSVTAEAEAAAMEALSRACAALFAAASGSAGKSIGFVGVQSLSATGTQHRLSTELREVAMAHRSLVLEASADAAAARARLSRLRVLCGIAEPVADATDALADGDLDDFLGAVAGGGAPLRDAPPAVPSKAAAAEAPAAMRAAEAVVAVLAAGLRGPAGTRAMVASSLAGVPEAAEELLISMLASDATCSEEIRRAVIAVAATAIAGRVRAEALAACQAAVVETVDDADHEQEEGFEEVDDEAVVQGDMVTRPGGGGLETGAVPTASYSARILQRFCTQPMLAVAAKRMVSQRRLVEALSAVNTAIITAVPPPPGAAAAHPVCRSLVDVLRLARERTQPDLLAWGLALLDSAMDDGIRVGSAVKALTTELEAEAAAALASSTTTAEDAATDELVAATAASLAPASVPASAPAAAPDASDLSRPLPLGRVTSDDSGLARRPAALVRPAASAASEVPSPSAQMRRLHELTSLSGALTGLFGLLWEQLSEVCSSGIHAAASVMVPSSSNVDSALAAAGSHPSVDTVEALGDGLQPPSLSGNAGAASIDVRRRRGLFMLCSRIVRRVIAAAGPDVVRDTLVREGMLREVVRIVGYCPDPFIRREAVAVVSVALRHTSAAAARAVARKAALGRIAAARGGPPHPQALVDIVAFTLRFATKQDAARINEARRLEAKAARATHLLPGGPTGRPARGGSITDDAISASRALGKVSSAPVARRRSVIGSRRPSAARARARAAAAAVPAATSSSAAGVEAAALATPGASALAPVPEDDGAVAGAPKSDVLADLDVVGPMLEPAEASMLLCCLTFNSLASPEAASIWAYVLSVIERYASLGTISAATRGSDLEPVLDALELRSGPGAPAKVESEVDRVPSLSWLLVRAFEARVRVARLIDSVAGQSAAAFRQWSSTLDSIDKSLFAISSATLNASTVPGGADGLGGLGATRTSTALDFSPAARTHLCGELVTAVAEFSNSRMECCAPVLAISKGLLASVTRAGKGRPRVTPAQASLMLGGAARFLGTGDHSGMSEMPGLSHSSEADVVLAAVLIELVVVITAAKGAAGAAEPAEDDAPLSSAADAGAAMGAGGGARAADDVEDKDDDIAGTIAEVMTEGDKDGIARRLMRWVSSSSIIESLGQHKINLLRPEHLQAALGMRCCGETALVGTGSSSCVEAAVSLLPGHGNEGTTQAMVAAGRWSVYGLGPIGAVQLERDVSGYAGSNPVAGIVANLDGDGISSAEQDDGDNDAGTQDANEDDHATEGVMNQTGGVAAGPSLSRLSSAIDVEVPLVVDPSAAAAVSVLRLLLCRVACSAAGARVIIDECAYCFQRAMVEHHVDPDPARAGKFVFDGSGPSRSLQAIAAVASAVVSDGIVASQLVAALLPVVSHSAWSMPPTSSGMASSFMLGSGNAGLVLPSSRIDGVSSLATAAKAVFTRRESGNVDSPSTGEGAVGGLAGSMVTIVSASGDAAANLRSYVRNLGQLALWHQQSTETAETDALADAAAMPLTHAELDAFLGSKASPGTSSLGPGFQMTKARPRLTRGSKWGVATKSSAATVVGLKGTALQLPLGAPSGAWHVDSGIESAAAAGGAAGEPVEDSLAWATEDTADPGMSLWLNAGAVMAAPAADSHVAAVACDGSRRSRPTLKPCRVSLSGDTSEFVFTMRLSKPCVVSQIHMPLVMWRGHSDSLPPAEASMQAMLIHDLYGISVVDVAVGDDMRHLVLVPCSPDEVALDRPDPECGGESRITRKLRIALGTKASGLAAVSIVRVTLHLGPLAGDVAAASRARGSELGLDGEAAKVAEEAARLWSQRLHLAMGLSLHGCTDTATAQEMAALSPVSAAPLSLGLSLVLSASNAFPAVLSDLDERLTGPFARALLPHIADPICGSRARNVLALLAASSKSILDDCSEAVFGIASHPSAAAATLASELAVAACASGDTSPLRNLLSAVRAFGEVEPPPHAPAYMRAAALTLDRVTGYGKGGLEASLGPAAVDAIALAADAVSLARGAARGSSLEHAAMAVACAVARATDAAVVAWPMLLGALQPLNPAKPASFLAIASSSPSSSEAVQSALRAAGVLAAATRDLTGTDTALRLVGGSLAAAVQVLGSPMSVIVRSSAVLAACLACIEDACLDAGVKRAVGPILIPAIIASLCAERETIAPSAAASGAGAPRLDTRQAPASVQSAALSVLRRLVNGQPANQQLVASALMRVLTAPEGASQFALRVLVDAATMEETLHAVVQHPVGADSLLPAPVTEAAVEGTPLGAMAGKPTASVGDSPAARRAAKALAELRAAAKDCQFDADGASTPSAVQLRNGGKTMKHSAGSYTALALTFPFPESGCYDVVLHIEEAGHAVTVGLTNSPMHMKRSFSGSGNLQNAITLRGERCELKRNGTAVHSPAFGSMPRLKAGLDFVMRVDMDEGRLSVAQSASGPFVHVADHIRWLCDDPPPGTASSSAPDGYADTGQMRICFVVALTAVISLRTITIVKPPREVRTDSSSAEALLSGAAAVRGSFDALTSVGCASDATLSMLSVVPAVAVPASGIVADVKSAACARGPRFLWHNDAGASVSSHDRLSVVAFAAAKRSLAATRVATLRTKLLGCLAAAGVAAPETAEAEADSAAANAVAAAGSGRGDVFTLSYELAWRAATGSVATAGVAVAQQQWQQQQQQRDGGDTEELADVGGGTVVIGTTSAAAAASVSGATLVVPPSSAPMPTLSSTPALVHSKAPVFRTIAASGGLPPLVLLMQERLSVASGAWLAGEEGLLRASEDESSVDYEAPKRVTQVRSVQWSRFLGTTTCLLKVPGFGEHFVTDASCQALFLHALCAGAASAESQLPTVTAEAAYEPVWTLLQPLQALLDANSSTTEAGAEVRRAIATSGAFDRLCLELGRVSESAPVGGEAWLSTVEEAQEMLYRNRQRELKEHKARESQTKRDRVGWKAGLGYGHDAEGASTVSASKAASIAKKAAAKDQRQSQISHKLLRIITAVLRAPLRHGDAVADTAEERTALIAVAGTACSTLPPALADSVAGSPLPSVLRACLNASSSQMAGQLDMYKAAFDALAALALEPRCSPVFTGSTAGESPLLSLVQAKGVASRSSLEFDSATSAGMAAVSSAGSAAFSSSPEDIAEANEAAALSALANATAVVDSAVEASKTWAKAEALRTKPGTGGDAADGDESGDAAAAASASGGSDDLLSRIKAQYVEAMKAGRFGSADFAGAGGMYSVHKYGSKMKGEESSISSKMVKRTKKDLKTLSTDLPTSWESSILVRYDKKRPYMLKAVIFGPDDTPYQDGAFVFDIYTGAKYPSEPPTCNIVNTGGGKHRHNPNLYANGKVCLSLLGTWRAGSKAEEWNPKSSSLWQLLISIQAFILVKDPWANEPGLEAYIGTEKGDRIARYEENGGYEILRRGTLRHAMLDLLKHPPVGFEKEIREHFRLKRSSILRMADGWLAEAQDSDNAAHPKQVAETLKELREELAKLGPSPSDDLDPEGDAAASAAAAAPGFVVTEEEKQHVTVLRSICPDTGDNILLHVLRSSGSIEAAADKCFTSVAADKTGYLAAHPEILTWPLDVLKDDDAAGSSDDGAAAASSSTSASAESSGSAGMDAASA